MKGSGLFCLAAGFTNFPGLPIFLCRKDDRERTRLMRWLTREFRVKMLLFFIMAMALPVFCGAIDLELPGLKLKYGKLERDREVTQIFETYQILEDHAYYINGWGSIPYAIIAIDDQYKLRKGLWKKVDITVPLLRGWVSQMDMVYGYPPYGSRILDHKGNPLGMWYSSKQWTTVVIEEENQIAVFTPEPPGFRGGK
jgi:hypothetical protein